jgi:serine/threonine-protein phosphatase 5
MLENYGRAIEDGRKAIQYNPKFIKPYFRIGTAYMALEKYEDAEKICNEALQVCSN